MYVCVCMSVGFLFITFCQLFSLFAFKFRSLCVLMGKGLHRGERRLRPTMEKCILLLFHPSVGLGNLCKVTQFFVSFWSAYFEKPGHLHDLAIFTRTNAYMHARIHTYIFTYASTYVGWVLDEYSCCLWVGSFQYFM